MFDFLRKIPLFSGLSGEDLSRLCGMVKEVRLRAGEKLFGEGSPGDLAYVIMEGQIEISKLSDGTNVLLAVRGAGELIGQLQVTPHLCERSIPLPQLFIGAKALLGQTAQVGVPPAQQVAQRDPDGLFLIFARAAQRIQKWLVAGDVKAGRVNTGADPCNTRSWFKKTCWSRIVPSRRSKVRRGLDLPILVAIDVNVNNHRLLTQWFQR